jgi:phosphoglycolate phosphatase-like HAD superfamily hydrolase
MIRGAAFDFDGTLVDSNEIKRRAFFEVAAAFDPDGDLVRDTLDRQPSGDRYAIARSLATAIAERGPLPETQSAHDLAKSLADAYTAHCERAVSTCPPIAGAENALHRLAERRLPLFLITATPLEAVLPILRLRGLDRLFEGVYGGPATKLENLRQVSAEIGARPRDMVFIGDGEDDRRAAVAFGCVFIGVTPDETNRFEHPPGRQIRDLQDLPGLLEEIDREAS